MMAPSKMLINEISQKTPELESKLCKRFEKVEPIQILNSMTELSALNSMVPKVTDRIKAFRAEIGFYDNRIAEIRKDIETGKMFLQKLTSFEDNITKNINGEKCRKPQQELKINIDVSELEQLKIEISKIKNKLQEFQDKHGISLERSGGNILISHRSEKSAFDIGLSVINDKIRTFPLTDNSNILPICEEMNATGEVSKFSSELLRISSDT
ncbi:hypothetical protein RF11_13447 [Thelohanellus kitauei]|uniref:Uncharacterized protein n=1 Tax=Thelohanellus kitauei TaxID=669202 RepID=A0A0C2JKN6_THEKT|nr:hypothetical protein RF11_13447 [Thelohanellus kitauei]